MRMDKRYSLKRNKVIEGGKVEYQKGRKNNRTSKWDSKKMLKSLKRQEKKTLKEKNEMADLSPNTSKITLNIMF